VAEAAGSAAAAGLNTTLFAEAIAAAFQVGSVPAQAMTEAFTQAAQTGGCRRVYNTLGGKHCHSNSLMLLFPAAVCCCFKYEVHAAVCICCPCMLPLHAASALFEEIYLSLHADLFVQMLQLQQLSRTLDHSTRSTS
jgi:hypothetical protein